MNRNHGIDGLRGLAALVVVVSHFLCAFYPATDTLRLQDVRVLSLEQQLSVTPFNLLYNGNFAVCVFFVISGYVLSVAFFASGNRDVVYASAYRRYLRLMIPVCVTSLGYAVFLQEHWMVTKQLAIVGESPWMQRMWNTPVGWGHFITSTLYDLFVHQELEPPYNPVLWSIGIEMKGSYLVYVFLVAMGHHRWRIVGYLALIVFTLQSYYVLFVAGMLISDVQARGKLPQPSFFMRGLLLAVACYTGSYKFTQEVGWWRILDSLRGFLKPQAVGAVCLFVVCLQSRGAMAMLTNRLATFLGRISYSLYLVHLLVIGSVSGVVYEVCVLIWHWGYAAATGAAFVVTLALSIWLAKVCTKWIDDSGVAFSKWLYERVFR